MKPEPERSEREDGPRSTEVVMFVVETECCHNGIFRRQKTEFILSSDWLLRGLEI
jgi:hypothetical protein